jgi:hypothetical protein
MATETLEERIALLETRLKQVEERLEIPSTTHKAEKRGWRWFVGIFEDSPDFEEVVKAGKEWRNADRPNGEDAEP